MYFVFNLKPGMILPGVVKKKMPYGLFVDINGLTGLVPMKVIRLLRKDIIMYSCIVFQGLIILYCLNQSELNIWKKEEENLVTTEVERIWKKRACWIDYIFILVSALYSCGVYLFFGCHWCWASLRFVFCMAWLSSSWSYPFVSNKDVLNNNKMKTET